MKDLRSEIDLIDDQVISLLARRFHLVREIGEHKKANAIDVVDPVRDSELEHNHQQTALKTGIDPAFIAKVFKVVVEESKKIQSGSGISSSTM